MPERGHTAIDMYTSAGDDDASAKDSRRNPCSRRMCICFVGLIVVVIIAVVVVMFLVGPSIAQKGLDGSSIEIARVTMSSPSSNQVTLSADLRVSSSAPLSANLGATKFSFKSMEGTVIGSFRSPELKIAAGETSTLSIENSVFTVENQEAWEVFSRRLVTEKDVEWKMIAIVDVKSYVVGIPFSFNGLSLDKKVSTPGMNRLASLEIGGMDLSLSTAIQVITKIDACMLNPSSINIDPVGNLCMDVQTEDGFPIAQVQGEVRIGITASDESDPFCVQLGKRRYPNDSPNPLQKGYNRIQIQGAIKNPLEVNGRKSFEKLMSQFLSGGVSTAIKATTCYPQATSVELYNKAMQNLTINSTIYPLGNPLISGLSMEGTSLNVPANDQLANEMVEMQIQKSVVTVDSPLGPTSALNIEELTLRANLGYSQGSNNLRLGSLETTNASTTIIAGTVVGKGSELVVQLNSMLKFPQGDGGASFGQLVKTAINSREIQMDVDGTSDIVVSSKALGKLRLVGIPVKVAVNLRGMDKLSNVSIPTFSLTKDLTSGEKMDATIDIWNPSLFSLVNPSLDLDLIVPSSVQGRSSRANVGTQIGQVKSIASTLGTGSNAVGVTGVLAPPLRSEEPTLLDASACEMFSRYMRNEESLVTSRVRKVNSPANWLQVAMKDLELQTKLSGVGKNFKLMSDISMPFLSVSFDSTRPDSVLVKSNIAAKVNLPPSFKIPVAVLGVEMSVLLGDKSGMAIGRLDAPQQPVQYDQTTQLISVNMESYQELKIQDASRMQNFVSELFLSPSSSLTIMTESKSIRATGLGITPLIETNMGVIPLSQLPLSAQVPLAGINSFSQVPVQINGVIVKRGQQDGLTIQQSIALTNPSPVETSINKLTLFLYYKNQSIGSTVVENLTIGCCNATTTVNGITLLQPASAEIRDMFLSNFVSEYYENTINVQILGKGNRQSTDIALLEPAIQNLQMASTIPTLRQMQPNASAMVLSARMYMPSLFNLKEIGAMLALRNPFGESVNIMSMSVMMVPCKTKGTTGCAEYFDKPLAQYTIPKRNGAPYVSLPANTKECYSCCEGKDCQDPAFPLCPQVVKGECPKAKVMKLLSIATISTLLDAAQEGDFMSVDGEIEVQIGAYPATLRYKQKDLLVKLAK